MPKSSMSLIPSASSFLPSSDKYSFLNHPHPGEFPAFRLIRDSLSPAREGIGSAFVTCEGRANLSQDTWL